MSQELSKEEQIFQTKKNFITKCVQLSKFFYEVSDSRMDQLKGLFISTLPNLVKDESFQNVEKSLQNRFDQMKDDPKISDKVKNLTKSHVQCISRMRILNKENPEFLSYSKKLFDEFKA